MEPRSSDARISGRRDPLPGRGTAALLHGIAWAALAAGTLGGLWTFQVLGTVEVPTPSSIFGAGEPNRVLNPVGVALGAGFVAQGIVFFALCRGIALAVENTVALARRLDGG